MKYDITGMSCAACSSRIEKAVSAIDGVEVCAVNLLANTMEVSGTASEEKIVSAVTGLGYGIRAEGKNKEEKSQSRQDMLVLKLVVSLILSVLLMYIAMGHNMWNFPLPSFFENNSVAVAITQMLIAGAVLVINQRFFISGFKGAIKGAPNMDTLISLGSGISFLYSVFIVFRMTENKGHLHELYFESSAMILALISLGKTLESYSKGKTTNAINSLINLKPQNATIVIDGTEKIVTIENVKIGDIFAVKPGESISCDGVVIDGESSVDQSMLTGESVPVDKKAGDSVYGATLNKSGYMLCRVTKTGEETALAHIIKTVSDASQGKAPIARIADKVAGVFVPVIVAVSLITLVIWLIVSHNVSQAVERAISVLVISCPCALGLATPVAIMVGSGVGARRGILFKSSAALEETGRIKQVVLDKTGTVTQGIPSVTDIISDDEELLLKVAYSLEMKSKHPLAEAVVKYAEDKGIEPFNTEKFISLTGHGVQSYFEGKELLGGNLNLVKDIDEKHLEQHKRLASEGKTPLHFSFDGKYLGIIAVADKIKSDSKKAVTALKKAGIAVYMITGDNALTASSVAKEIGIDSCFSEALPEDKANIIKELQKNGKVLMIGDGINDAPALTLADVGMAIGAGCDIAIDAGDVVLMKDSISDAVDAIRLGKLVLRKIKQNLFWAFFYNCIGIPLAAGAFSSFGLEIGPMFGAAAMSLSSIFVVFNALSINLFGGKKKMKKTVKIEGMMCPHCEARVKNLLEGVDKITSAEVSHKKGTAVITLLDEIDNDMIITLIEKDGYKVIDII